MIGVVSAKYALRSLLRHTRRTILSIVGVGIGCSIALIARSWMGGSAEMQIRAVSESGAGHVCVVPVEWPRTRENTLRLVNWHQALDAAKSLPNVNAVAIRARANALLAFGNRTAGIEIVGVDPEAEPEANRIVGKARIEGRYLREDDSGNVVIGRALAERLDVELDDDLYVTLSGRDEIKSAMLTIVGLLETGARDIDSSVCHVTLGDLQRITGYTGPAEISILLDDYKDIESARRELLEKVGEGNTVITWKEANPGFAGNVEGDKAFMTTLVFIIVIVVSLGIASAQLTAVLERRREFAILSALGMKRRQVIGLMTVEALVVGLGGSVIALMVGGGFAHLLATRGVSLAGFFGEELTFGEVLLDPYIYGEFGVWLVWYALAISVIATVVASVYPAWLATKIDPAEALRVV
jgi:ABC-type lipoprotein release transport system permease subunit